MQSLITDEEDIIFESENNGNALFSAVIGKQRRKALY